MYSQLERRDEWQWLWTNESSLLAGELRALEAKLIDPQLIDPVIIAHYRNILAGMKRVATIVSNGAAAQRTDAATTEEVGPAPQRRRTPYLTSPLGG